MTYVYDLLKPHIVEAWRAEWAECKIDGARDTNCINMDFERYCFYRFAKIGRTFSFVIPPEPVVKEPVKLVFKSDVEAKQKPKPKAKPKTQKAKKIVVRQQKKTKLDEVNGYFL